MTTSEAVAPADGWLERRELLLLAVLTALALALRVIRLDAGLWFDEIASLDTFRESLPELLTRFRDENQHPLYSLLAHLSRGLFGERPWALRLPAVLFGAACVPALYLLGRELSWRREGLLAGLLLAAGYHPIWFSQNARGYTALTFFTLVSTLLLLRWLRRPRASVAIGWAASTALGIYTLPTMAFVATAQGLVAGWCVVREYDLRRDHSMLVRLLSLLVLAVGLTLTLYAPTLDQVVRFFFVERPFRGPSPSGLLWALGEGMRGLRSGFGSWLVLAAVGLLAAAGAWSLARRRPLELALITAPAVLTLVGAVAIRGAVMPRYLVHFLPFGYLLLAGGLCLAAEAVGRRVGLSSPVPAWTATLLALLLVAGQAPALARNYRLPKQDFEGALRWIEETAVPDDVIAVVGVTDVYTTHWGRPWRVLRRPEELSALRSDKRVWVLYTLPRYVAFKNPPMWSTLQRLCRAPRIFPGTLGDGALTVCEIAPLESSVLPHGRMDGW